MTTQPFVNNQKLLDNINTRRRAQRISIAKLAERTQVPVKTLRKVLDGTTASPKINTVARIAHVLGCSTSELLGETAAAPDEVQLIRAYRCLSPVGRDALLRFAKSYETAEAQDTSRQVERQIPLYTLPVSAGTGNFLDSSTSESLRLPAASLPDTAAYAVRVSGDSMDPVLHEDDIVLIEQIKAPRDGDIVVVIINGDSFIKQFEGGRFLSLNPLYSPICPGEFDEVHIVGRLCSAQPLVA